ncbi:hsp70 family chaperone [Apiospora saccharicola]
MGLSDVLGRFASTLRGGNAGSIGDGDELLVIGIDFGTTSSGVGWATTADIANDQINVMTSWPGSGREEGKAPTELFYEHGKMTWGFEVGNDCDPVRWFKLLLLKEEDLDPSLRSSEFVLRGRQHMRDEGKTAVELVADYLRALWCHILKSIAKARGEVVVDVSRFHVVITVPAIWRPYARQTMRDAAEKAGILKKRMIAGDTCLSFVAEPEAAALSTLSESGRNPQEDDVYLICDGGGGTVDLITYKILETGPLGLEEAVEGSGAWEYGPKYQFSLSHDMDYVISIPSAAFAKEKHVQAIFDEVMADIDVLVDGQIADAKAKNLHVTGIILVGGLGSSPYLYEHLRDRQRQSKINVLQSGGERPRVAICRGAVLSGFLKEQENKTLPGEESVAPVKVVSTIARASYGVIHYAPWDSTQHNKEDQFWHEKEQAWFARDRLRWYLKKGSNVTAAQPVSHRFYTLLDPLHAGNFDLKFFQCGEASPPTAVNSSVTPLCTISCKSAIPFSDIPDFINGKGQKFKKLWYDVDMLPSGACVEFSVWSGWKKLGSSEVQIRFD